MSKESRIIVVYCQALRSALERDQTCGCKNTGLPHSAAEHFSNTATALNKFSSSYNHGSDGRAKSLAQVELDRVEFRGHVRHVFPKVCRRVEDTREVQMNGDACGVRFVADLFNDGGRVNLRPPYCPCSRVKPRLSADDSKFSAESLSLRYPKKECRLHLERREEEPLRLP